ncbi:nucleotidyltransferase family protein [Desulfitobacterium sp. AusDCA]|uniref:nucleotidyltransferase family protein n=1 Tax=Desulfitobacterium sp. AusDCA TaxID=3240383 RepID=UPI003DA77C00
MVRFVVMASGQATRMGQDKLSLPWQDSTVLEYVLQVLEQALNRVARAFKIPAEVWVIVRKPLQEYLKSEDWAASDKKELDNPVKHIWLNAPAPRPLSETIRLGIADLPEKMQGICFIPGDQVGLEPIKLAELISFFIENQPDFLVPWVAENKLSGSPVFFHKLYYQELCSLQGEQGGRAVLNRYPERWVKYSVPPEFLEDIDTPEDYRRLRSLKLK